VSLALQVSPRTVEELGRDGIAELAAHLWSANCQSCGRPLDEQPPALLVDDLMVSAAASLHHPQCQRPEWNDSGGIKMTSTELLTHRTCALMMPLPYDRPAKRLPMLLVNPGLEMVMLRRGADHRWRVATVDLYAHHGLRQSAADLRSPCDGHPVPGVHAVLTDAGLSVGLAHATWTASIEPTVGTEIRRFAGLVLAVTTMVQPTPPAPIEPLVSAVRAGQVAMGWVRVDVAD
jgi:hypothetical protein